jgi:hypothetical protein
VGSILAIFLWHHLERSGNQRLAVLWTTPFFVTGLALLLLVRPLLGREQARAGGPRPEP